jgi:aminoglycoside phosphotransferase (APT) family kinase protein
MDHQTRERERIVRALLGALDDGADTIEVASATWRRHSNDVGRIELDDGRVLMVKAGRFDWVGPRFRAERRAARWLDERGIVAPRHLDVPERVEGRPVLCYWRIDLPTLSTVWRRSGARERQSALRSWGALLRRVHAVPVPGCGPLAGDGPCRDPIDDFMAEDLSDRLRPAVASSWQAGLGPLDAAVEALPALEARVGGDATVLLHGDPHAGNVMCRVEDGAVRCEGLIDLETAAGGPRELDLAHALVLHGPLFAQALPDGWFEELRAGYGVRLDEFGLHWFALYHLLNLGFYSALVGDHEHAATVAEAAAERANGLGAVA